MPSSNYPQSVLINDPTQVINTIPNTAHNGQGLWSQLNSTGNTRPFGPIIDPLEEKLATLEKQFTDLTLTTKLLRLKILSLEGKFDKEEVANLRKMIMSEDEAARTLADSIIENA